MTDRDFRHIPLPAGATRILAVTKYQGVFYCATDVGICRLVDGVLEPVPLSIAADGSHEKSHDHNPKQSHVPAAFSKFKS